MRKETFYITVGQGIWAASQALLVLYLTYNGQMKLLGLYTLGLAIYTPICLAGGLNLRNLLSIDTENKIQPHLAIIFRIIVATVAIPITSLALYVYDKGSELWIISTILIAARISDQVSDVCAGVYQKQSKYRIIGLSYALRGVANIIPFVLSILITSNLKVASISVLITTIISTFVIDAYPTILRSIKDEFAGQNNIMDLFRSIRPSILSSPFPLLDSLHMNSLRYALSFNYSAETMGLIGLAQTLYSPIQLLITSIGYTNITKVKIIVHSKNNNNLNNNLIIGMLIALVPSIILMTIIILLNSFLLINVSSHYEFNMIVVAIFLSYIPLAMSGFVSQAMISAGLMREYIISPLIGIIVFLFLFALSNYLINTNIIIIFLMFIASGVIRLSYALYNTYNLFNR